jgi:TrpR-related protein YerC/YecD
MEGDGMLENKKDVELLAKAFLNLETVEECYAFFDDIFTKKEQEAFAQRIHVAKMLIDDATYVDIENETKCSATTISRVNRCILYGNGGYSTVISRMEEE